MVICQAGISSARRCLGRGLRASSSYEDQRIRRLHIRRWRIRRMDGALSVSADVYLQPVTVFPTSFVGKELYPPSPHASNGGIRISDILFSQVTRLVSVLHITLYRKEALPLTAFPALKSARPIIRIRFGRWQGRPRSRIRHNRRRAPGKEGHACVERERRKRKNRAGTNAGAVSQRVV